MLFATIFHRDSRRIAW